MKKLKLRLVLVSFVVYMLLCISLIAESRGKFSEFTANVMAPLNLPTAIYSLNKGIDWSTGETITDSAKQSYQSVIDQFQKNIKAAAAIGVDAVSMDVWWGLVEKEGDQQFDWSPYKSIFTMIKDAGLEIQAIMSFHQCGGNVGDNVNIPIPSWIWEIAGNGAKYCGEQFIGQDYDESTYGNPEIVSLWASNNSAVHTQYQQYMDSFEEFVGSNGFANDIQAISISCGPAGECRYPSYDTYTAEGINFGQGYPTRGYLQCYSQNAITSFRNSMKEKYGTLENISNAWGSSFSSWDSITPPTNGNGFFNIQNSYITIQYGQDFINWYNQELVKHGQNMINDALTAFDASLASTTVGIKIPGIHWQMASPNSPRSAEACAGLLSSNFQIDVYNYGCGIGYNNLLNMIKGNDLSSNGGRKVNVYFTCLEMCNSNPGTMDNGQYPYSLACSLVYGVGKQANSLSLQIKGENALAPNSGWSWDGSPLSGTPSENNSFGGGPWCNINYAIENSYDGINILRVSDVTASQAQYGNFYGLIVLHSENSNVPESVPNLTTEEDGI